MIEGLKEVLGIIWTGKRPGVVGWVIAVFLTAFALELALVAPIAVFLWEKLGKK